MKAVFAVIVVIGVVVLILLGVLALIWLFYRKVAMGHALIVNRYGKKIDVFFTGGTVWPVVNKAEIMDISVKAMEIDRRGKDGLICSDNIRADITVTFFVRVSPSQEDVLKVAQSVGCERASTKETLHELFGAKFSEALKTVGKQMDFIDLYTERDSFKERIIGVIGENLNGYSLEDVAIDYLEQTPLGSLDADNILDAQGIRKIVELTAKEAISTNEFQRNKERTIKQQDVETREKVLELERQEADATARQRREVETLQARETAETEKVRAEQALISEKARIATDEQIAVANQNKERQVIIARKNKERTDAIESERVTRDRDLEATERERLVALKQIEKEKDVEVEKKNIQEVIRERVSVERTVAEEEEKIKDTREIAGAERIRKTEVIAAEREAQKGKIEITVQAEAKEEAARHLFEEMSITAEAERVAAEKQSEAKKVLAAGIVEERAAEGLAEVKVREANAHATEVTGKAEASASTERHRADAFGIEASGDAEAKSMRAKYSAEAEGVSAKAEAMKKLDEVGREHEEFKLRLAKAERVEIAQIDVQRKIAEYQSQVMGEAMKTAKIELIGGGQEFLDTFFKSIALGKAVDGFVNHSEVIQGLSDGGDGKALVEQLKGLIGKEGLSAESIKDLSIAALLTRLAAGGKDKSTRDKALQLKRQIEDQGLGTVGLDNVIGEWLASGQGYKG